MLYEGGEDGKLVGVVRKSDLTQNEICIFLKLIADVEPTNWVSP
jgi:hypothetical protein